MSTYETPPTTNQDIPRSRAEWVWLLWRVVPVFIFMGFVIWVLFSWVQDGRAEQNKRIDKLEAMVKDCATDKKDRMEESIEKANKGIEELMRRIPNKNH